MQLAFLRLEDFNAVLGTFKAARGSLGEILSSCEFIDGHALKCAEDNLSLSCPLQTEDVSQSFYMLIETSGSK